MRKPDSCLYENEDENQLRSNFTSIITNTFFVVVVEKKKRKIFVEKKKKKKKKKKKNEWFAMPKDFHILSTQNNSVFAFEVDM